MVYGLPHPTQLMSNAPPSRDQTAVLTPSASAFDGLLPEAAAVVEARAPHLWVSGLLQEEEHVVAHAVEKRRREFTAGRNCARLALKRLGMAPVAIGTGDFREPLFPAGVSGSITHTQGYCAAAVVRTGAVLSIGVDAESNERLCPSVVDLVLNADEQRMVQAFGLACSADMLLFSIKEAFFKATFPLLRKYLEFSDTIVTLSPTERSFDVRLVRADMRARLGQARIVGRYRFERRRLYTAVSLFAPVLEAGSHPNSQTDAKICCRSVAR